jgi:hypothetical protein
MFLEHASHVVREAGRQAANAGREEVVPRECDHHHVRHSTTRVASGRAVADTARDKVQRDVLPAVCLRPFASALAVLEVSKDPRVREALSNVRRAADRFGAKVGVVPPKLAGPPAATSPLFRGSCGRRSGLRGLADASRWMTNSG